jgi:hypothetical protein
MGTPGAFPLYVDKIIDNLFKQNETCRVEALLHLEFGVSAAGFAFAAACPCAMPARDHTLLATETNA